MVKKILVQYCSNFHHIVAKISNLIKQDNSNYSVSSYGRSLGFVVVIIIAPLPGKISFQIKVLIYFNNIT